MDYSETHRQFKKAELLRQKSRYGESLAFFRKALSGYRALRAPQGVLDCRMSIGDVHRMIGNYDLAEKSYSAAAAVAKNTEDIMAAADADTNIALCMRGRGDWKHALPLLQKTLAFYEKNGDRQATAFSLWAIAGTLRIKGDIPGAIRAYNTALKLFRQLRLQPAVGYSLCGLGGTHRIAGMFSESLDYYRGANRLFSGIGDRFGTAYSYCGIGNAYRMQGHYKKALANFDRASKIYNAIGDRVSYSYTLWSIGTTYKMLDDHVKARRYFSTAQGLFRKTRDPRGLIYCMLGTGEIAMLEGRKKQAENYIRESVRLADEYGFKVEQCHAALLASSLGKKLKTACYNKLGLNLSFTRAPFNIP
jgi:tetratricopeptide (TPR) repeat protein